MPIKKKKIETAIVETFIVSLVELGPPVSESLTRVSKFYDPTYSEHKFHKTRIKNWLSIAFKLGFSWLRTYSHNHYIILNLQCNGES